MLGDVSREEDVRRILGRSTGDAAAGGGDPFGGGARDGTLLNQNWERFEEVLAPKVLGAWHLHRLTAGRDCGCSCCSPAPPPCWVAAARPIMRRPTLSGPACVGAACSGAAGLKHQLGGLVGCRCGVAGRGGLERLALQGVESMTPEQGIEVLGQLLSRDITEIAVANIRWSQFFKAWPAAEAFPLLCGRRESAEGPIEGSSMTGDGSAFRDTFQSLARSNAPNWSRPT